MALFGNNKKYKDGIKAGAAPFEKILEDQSKQTKESMDAINANVDSIHSVVDVVLDDLVAQEKKRVYNLDSDYDVLALDQDEREFAIAMLYTLSQSMDETTEKQKQYLLNIQRYLNIRNPQIQIEVSSIENIENLKTQKMLYRIVTEYLFLAQENFEYAENFDYIFDYFSINRQSKNSIRGNIENIYKAVGADGLIGFYCYMSDDIVTDSTKSIIENESDLEKSSEEWLEESDAANDVEIDSSGQATTTVAQDSSDDFFNKMKAAFKNRATTDANMKKPFVTYSTQSFVEDESDLEKNSEERRKESNAANDIEIDSSGQDTTTGVQDSSGDFLNKVKDAFSSYSKVETNDLDSHVEGGKIQSSLIFKTLAAFESHSKIEVNNDDQPQK